MNIGICDDDALFLNALSTFVPPLCKAEEDILIQALNPTELSNLIGNKDFNYDILITDIHLGDQNGIELAKKINVIYPNCYIIFLSNYLNYATEVYDANHIYFVLKAQYEQRLPIALEKAMDAYLETHTRNLIIQYQGIETILPMNSILYIESLGRYLVIHTVGTSIKCIKNLKDISLQLSGNFIRCHNSYIINFQYIRSITRSECTLTTSQIIPISQTYGKGFRAKYMELVSMKLA